MTDAGVTKFEHREPIIKNETDVGQFAICVSFLRKCIPSTTPVSCDIFLKAIDIYIQSGFSKHPCSDTVSKQAEDEEAKKYLNLDKGSCAVERRNSVRAQRISRGILVAAGIYLRIARLGDLIWRDEKGIEYSVDGPSVEFFLEVPKLEHAQSFVPPQPSTRARSGSRSLPTSPREVDGPIDLSTSPPTKLERTNSNPFFRKLASFVTDKNRSSKGS